MHSEDHDGLNDNNFLISRLSVTYSSVSYKSRSQKISQSSRTPSPYFWRNTSNVYTLEDKAYMYVSFEEAHDRLVRQKMKANAQGILAKARGYNYQAIHDSSLPRTSC